MSLSTYYLSMAAILCDSTVAAVVIIAVVAVHSHPRAIQVAMITMKKSIPGFLFLSYTSMGLYLVVLRAAGALLLSLTRQIITVITITN